MMHSYLIKRAKKKIMQGPFAGLFFDSRLSTDAIPKILGTYQKELHTILEANSEEQFEKLIMIGSHSDYYSIGLGKKLKRPVVVFSDADHKELMRLSLKNRIELFIKPKFQFETNTNSKKDLIIADFENKEKILTGERFYNWKQSVLVIEVYSSERKETIVERSKSTHNSFFIPRQPKTISDYPFTPPFVNLFSKKWLNAIQETKPSIGWIIFEPKE